MRFRAKLSPAGNVVSEAGRRRTMEVFGEPLSPQQVVERICGDVQQRGLGGGAGLFAEAGQGGIDGGDDSRLRRRS